MDSAVTGDVTIGTTSDGSESNWRESIPEILREAPFFKNAQSLEHAKTQIDNAAFWRGNSILKPGANASEEDMAANRAKVLEMYPDFMPIPDPYSQEAGDIFTKLGRPDAADKYKMPEGFDVDPDEAGLLKAIALDSNMTQAQFEKYQSSILTKRKEMAELRANELQTGLAALKGQWGAAYEGNHKQVATMLATDSAVPPSMKAAFEAGQLDATTVQWLYNIAQRGDEQTEIPGQPINSGVMTPEQGKQEAADIRARMFKMSDMDPLRPILMKKLIEAERYSAGLPSH